MKKLILILLTSAIIYSCSKTESTPTVTPPVVIKLSSCDSIKQGLLKTASDSVRLLFCLTISNCDSVRLGILKPNTQDTIRLLSCIKVSGCDSVRLGVLKPNSQDSLRLLSCIKITGCDSVRLGVLKPNSQDTLRLLSCIKITGCDSVRLGVLKPNKADTLRLLSCIKVSGCDSVRLGVLKPNTQDTLRLLTCIKISGCDSVRLGILKSAQDILRLDCHNVSRWLGWMDKNLDVTTYRNGDVIPQVTDQTAWAGLTTGAWCYYNNDPANGPIYGKLYNWYAVNDPRGLAPQGWHIPTNAEWRDLGNFLGGDLIAGGKMKTIGTSLWNSPNIGATNESGFSGLPAGYRGFNGTFVRVGAAAVWWSASELDLASARYLGLDHSENKVSRSDLWKYYGFSIRCIKD
jgi:uncharacterized protein (TIGR02145 family)